MIGFIVLGLVLVLILVLISMYNGLIKIRNMVREAFSTMDVYLKKRFDLVPNLVETVKGYASHEKSTFEEVTKARSAISNAGTAEEKLQGENMLGETLKSLFAVAEAYPDLKANTNFMDLQNQLKEIENEIALSRKYYNGVVREYNTKIQTVPTNIVANVFGFKEEPFFLATEEDREAVKVSF